jgi:hypothetical protein
LPRELLTYSLPYSVLYVQFLFGFQEGETWQIVILPEEFAEFVKGK